MIISETQPKPFEPTLPGADFADAWQATGIHSMIDAEQLAAKLNSAIPSWAKLLMGLRNALVSPFGLKTGREQPRRKTLFPVVVTTPGRVVLGMDDRHLDFRLVIEVAAKSRDRLIATATTYVRTHNRAGRLYLALVKPFHRIIVPAMLRRAVNEAVA
jgi:hypothetical protein